MLWLLEEKLGIRLPCFDTDKCHSQLVGYELLHVIVVAELHRPSAKPIADVGEIAHPSALLVLNDVPQHSSQLGNFVSHLEPPDVPPFHFSLLEQRGGIISLLYIEPELGRRVLLNVCGIERNVKKPASLDWHRGVANRLPDVSGVMKHSPRINDICSR